MLIVMKLDVVKNKELGFWTEIGCVGKSSKPQIAFGALCYLTRIKRVTFLGYWVDGIAN